MMTNVNRREIALKYYEVQTNYLLDSNKRIMKMMTEYTGIQRALLERKWKKNEKKLRKLLDEWNKTLEES